MTRVLRVIMVAALIILTSNLAFSSSAPNGIIKPDVGSLASRMDIPPKLAYNQIALGADLDEVYVLVANLSKTGDKVSIIAEDSENKRVVVVWEWNFTHPATGEQSGEMAFLKVFTNNRKVWGISLEHVTLNGENLERKTFERTTLDFMAEHQKKQ